MKASSLLTSTLQKDIIGFARDLIRIKSYSSQEEEAIKFVEQKMKALGYDEVHIDAMGNVVGRIGFGKKILMFDSHVDTVEVNDEQEWDFPPFNGDIVNGRIHGRGSVDMKSSLAASVYAAAIGKKMELIKKDLSVYVSCTVNEEDCDGENLKHLFTELDLRPDYMVICEPSNNTIAIGHKGKAQIKIRTKGISAHGATPEKGVNAIYEMAEIIQRVEKTNESLGCYNDRKGSLVLSKIFSISASLNAVPTECEIYLDRRLVPGESIDTVRQEMDRIVEGKNANWGIGTLLRKSWTGLDISYAPVHAPWNIGLGHDLIKLCAKAYLETFRKEPDKFEFWDFSTNAVTPVSMGIPTIGFGPGDYKLAHMRNESCDVQQILDACSFYIRVNCNM
ncbi:MAG: YgeY family selenium metabolism-linked hydrolase [Melioribacteraceae bacterium]|nr:YgeY family selenium metabolism-linked hydrolase [Melioribacteraceae bacterium]